jgi:hypothetical protein
MSGLFCAAKRDLAQILDFRAQNFGAFFAFFRVFGAFCCAALSRFATRQKQMAHKFQILARFVQNVAPIALASRE